MTSTLQDARHVQVLAPYLGAKPMAKKKTARKSLYETRKASVCLAGGDKPPIDASFAKEMMGWEVEGDTKFGKDFLLKVGEKKTKVRCIYNVTNRPLTMGNVLTLKQEILRGRWRFNGEPIIIGKNGSILNGQHQLIALILADMDYEENPDNYPALSGPPTIDKLVVVGVDEDDVVINTMDTCKPRSLGDVIYRSPYFSSLPSGERVKASRDCAHAIKLLWVRTGENLDGFSPRRTPSESVDFLERHPKLLEAINHITAENSEGKISNYLSPGYCAALLYLFAASETVQADYLNGDKLDEKNIDFSRWDEACDWFVMLAGGSLPAISKRLAVMTGDGSDSIDARRSLLIKAWNYSIEGKKLTDKSLKLKYEQGEDGYAKLVDSPIVGGLDIGYLDDLDRSILVEKEEEDPTQGEIDRIATATESLKVQKKKKGEPPKKAPVTKDTSTPRKKSPPKKKTITKKKASNPITGLLGKLRWTNSDDGEPYQVRVVGVRGKSAICQIENGHQGAGTEVIRPFNTLFEAQPT